MKKLKKITFRYIRAAIIDSKNRPVKPVIGFIFQPVSKEVEFMPYYASTEGRIRKIMGMKIKKFFTSEEDIIPLKYAMGYTGTYIAHGVEHTVIFAIARNTFEGNIMVMITMDSTTEVYPEVEQEFYHTLKSLKFTKKN